MLFVNKKAVGHFKKVDPILYKLAIELRVEEGPINHHEDYFVELVDTVLSQQLSGKAAATIFTRLTDLMPKKKITPENLIKLKDEEIRNAGISYAKIKYIKGIAHEIISKNLDLKRFDEQSDQAIKEELVKLKGIGPWSAEMFLMFSLGRPDIFSTGDLGLKNAVKKLYGLKKDPTEQELLNISSRWSPFRTYASRILWRSLA